MKSDDFEKTCYQDTALVQSAGLLSTQKRPPKKKTQLR